MQWIARLAETGLLRPSFVPPESRALGTDPHEAEAGPRPDKGVAAAGKLLEGALVKLSSAVHSPVRTKTARDIPEVIVGSERDTEKLAALVHSGVKGGHAAVRQALDGTTLGGYHLRLIRSTWTTSPCWTGQSRRLRTDRGRPGRD